MSENKLRKHKYRAFLYFYQKGQCAYCLKQMRLSFSHEPSGGNLATIDHVTPVSRGGRTTWSNIILCCSKCNNNKGSRGMKPKILPLYSIENVGVTTGKVIYENSFVTKIFEILYGATESYAVQTPLTFSVDMVESVISQPQLERRKR